jgi:predicted Zn-dependent peptidase
MHSLLTRPIWRSAILASSVVVFDASRAEATPQSSQGKTALPATALPATALRETALPETELLGWPKPERFTLPNGLTVIVQPDRRKLLVAALVAYEYGSRDDPPGYAGLAHLIEHLTFAGTRHTRPYDALNLITRAGATLVNAVTSADRTVYYAEVPPEALPLVLHLESDRLAFALEHWTGKDLLREQRTVEQELRQRLFAGADYPRLRDATWFPVGHAYAAPRLMAGLKTVATLTLDHVRYGFRCGYRPDRATIVLAGNVEVAHARELVERYFGPVNNPGGAPCPRPGHVELGEPGWRVVVGTPLERERVELSWALPPSDDPNYPSAELAARLLAEGDVSRIGTRVAGSFHIGLGFEESDDAALLRVWVDGATGSDLDNIESAMTGEVWRLTSRLATDQELEAVRMSALQDLVLVTERYLSRANLLLTSARRGTGTLFDPNVRAQRLLAVTPESVRSAAQRWLSEPTVVLRVHRENGNPYGAILSRRAPRRLQRP